MTAPVGEVTSATATGQEGQLALPLRRERALELEPLLQQLDPGAQLADVVELEVVDQQPDPAALRPVVDPAAEDELLAVLRQHRQPARVVRRR